MSKAIILLLAAILVVLIWGVGAIIWGHDSVAAIAIMLMDLLLSFMVYLVIMVITLVSEALIRLLRR